MTKEQIFAAWAPAESIWSTWAKPVLFAHMTETSLPTPIQATVREAGWAPNANERVALVLDLPRDEAIWAGLALADRGYRPVPLYNALPPPSDALLQDSESRASIAVVDTFPIVNALQQGAERLARSRIPADAPPAFLLDAERHGDNSRIIPEQFDNRSICFTTDFPSANFLLAHGIQRVLLVQRERTEPQEDFAHVLCRWQDGGLPLERLRIEEPAGKEPFRVKRPSWYGAMFQRALAAVGLRRAPGGGLGAWMPQSPAGG
jgi:hypothetical protein